MKSDIIIIINSLSLYILRWQVIPRCSIFPRCKTAARTRNKFCISSSVYVSTFIADRMFANSTASSRPSQITLPPCHYTSSSSVSPSVMSETTSDVMKLVKIRIRRMGILTFKICRVAFIL